MPNTTYRRLTNHKQEEISRCLAAEVSQAEIARKLIRYPSTISREIRKRTLAEAQEANIALSLRDGEQWTGPLPVDWARAD